MTQDAFAAHDDLLLAGDIGGTNARFRIVAPADLTQALFEKSYDDCTVQHACERFVEEIGEAASRIRTAGVGVAGRVVDGDVHLTNRPGETITNESIAEDLSLPADLVVVVNDMVCHLSGIEHCDVAPLRDGRPTGNVQGILMPGTGLGVGARVQISGQWHPLPSEGGHLDFGSPHADYEPVRQSLLQQVGGKQLTWEHAVSGPALPRLLRAFNPGATESPSPKEVTARYTAGDPAATLAVKTFLVLVGARAGNLCLDILATDALYLGGGILNMLHDHDDDFFCKHLSAGIDLVGPDVLKATVRDTQLFLLRSKDSGLIGGATLASERFHA